MVARVFRSLGSTCFRALLSSPCVHQASAMSARRSAGAAPGSPAAARSGGAPGAPAAARGGAPDFVTMNVGAKPLEKLDSGTRGVVRNLIEIAKQIKEKARASTKLHPFSSPIVQFSLRACNMPSEVFTILVARLHYFFRFSKGGTILVACWHDFFRGI